MEAVIDKAVLLEILRENKRRHQEVFEEAVEGWRRHVLDILAEKEKLIRAGRLPKAITISLPAPENHTRDYDRVIGMLELHQGNTFTLGDQEYSCYVNDDWDWKRRWTISNSGYASGKFAEVYGTDYLEEVVD